MKKRFFSITLGLIITLSMLCSPMVVFGADNVQPTEGNVAGSVSGSIVSETGNSIESETEADKSIESEAFTSFKATAKGYNSITLRWSQIQGATGYEVYMYKRGKGFVRHATISDSKASSYTVKSLSKKTKYYFKVRAYRAATSGTYYSKMSVEKSAKTTSSCNRVSFVKPVSKIKIISRFGWRGHRMHWGVDLKRPTGAAIYSAADGKVVKVRNRWGGYGKVIVVKHANGVKTYYAHCSKILVRNGQKVKRGQRIGKVGATGNATTSHVHFEVKIHGIYRNPAKYL